MSFDPAYQVPSVYAADDLRANAPNAVVGTGSEFILLGEHDWPRWYAMDDNGQRRILEEYERYVQRWPYALLTPEAYMHSVLQKLPSDSKRPRRPPQKHLAYEALVKQRKKKRRVRKPEEKRKSSGARKHEIRRGRATPVPQSLRDQVWRRDCDKTAGGLDLMSARCVVCSCAIARENFHCAHIEAVALGGLTVLDNLAVCCASCNLSMGTQNLNEFSARFFPHA